MSETDGPFGGIRYRLSEEPFFGFGWAVSIDEPTSSVVLQIWRLDDEDDKGRLGLQADKAKALSAALRDAAGRVDT